MFIMQEEIMKKSQVEDGPSPTPTSKEEYVHV